MEGRFYNLSCRATITFINRYVKGISEVKYMGTLSVSVYLYPEEIQDLKEYVSKKKMSKSAFIRTLILKELMKT